VSIDQTHSYVLPGQETTASVTIQSQRWLARATDVRGLLDGARHIRARIGIFGLAAFLAGIGLSFGGTIWAVQVGVSYPIAVMAGYCTLVGSICLLAALSSIFAPSQEATMAPVKPSATSAAWKFVNTFSVTDASRLWCNIEPGSLVTQESIAWARAILDAISRGELPIVEKAGRNQETLNRERNDPNWHTEIARGALKSWASSHGYIPNFLND